MTHVNEIIQNAGMVTACNINVESGGFSVLVSFLGPWKYPVGRPVNLYKFFLFVSLRHFWWTFLVEYYNTIIREVNFGKIHI